MNWKATHWVSECQRFLIIGAKSGFLLIDRGNRGRSTTHPTLPDAQEAAETLAANPDGPPTLRIRSPEPLTVNEQVQA